MRTRGEGVKSPNILRTSYMEAAKAPLSNQIQTSFPLPFPVVIRSEPASCQSFLSAETSEATASSSSSWWDMSDWGWGSGGSSSGGSEPMEEDIEVRDRINNRIQASPLPVTPVRVTLRLQ